MLKAPGVIYPEINQYPEGANSARTAAIVTNNQSIEKQTSLLKASSGGSYRKSYRKSYRTKKIQGGKILVPQFNILYPEPGTGGQTVNSNVLGTTILGANSAISSSFDGCIGQGPSCTQQVINSQKGGLKWGCYSGGKTKKYKKKKKNENEQK